jgi:hypothetical protein
LPEISNGGFGRAGCRVQIPIATDKMQTAEKLATDDRPEEIDPQDMYCFHCVDSDGDGSSTDGWVHVDILWDEFASKLARRFGRSVYFQYCREGEATGRKVQCEDDFEELCEYLDDTQVLVFLKLNSQSIC